MLWDPPPPTQNNIQVQEINWRLYLFNCLLLSSYRLFASYLFVVVQKRRPILWDPPTFTQTNIKGQEINWRLCLFNCLLSPHPPFASYLFVVVALKIPDFRRSLLKGLSPPLLTNTQGPETSWMKASPALASRGGALQVIDQVTFRGASLHPSPSAPLTSRARDNWRYYVKWTLLRSSDSRTPANATEATFFFFLLRFCFNFDEL